MNQFVVFINPLDYPGKVVVMEFVIESGKLHARQEPTYVGDSLDAARRAIPVGLLNIGRTPVDEPQIVEVWV